MKKRKVVIVAHYSHAVNGRPQLRAYKYDWKFRFFGPESQFVVSIDGGYDREELIEDVRNRLDNRIEILEIIEV